jgi:imidazolonepropionase-like amidohydrolase
VTSDATLVIRGVTVVDPRDGSLRAGQDVRITGEQIVSVEPARDDRAAPAAAQVVDAAGRYLVPGFADMHAHPLGAGDPAGSFDLMLAHGVTGFRQMSGSARMLKDRAAGTLMPADAPRLLAMPGAVLTPLNAGSAAAAAATVREQHDLGADFVKAALVTSEVFYQAQQEGRRLGIPVLGHLPNGIDVARASGEGVRSVEHLGPGVSLLTCCSAEQEAVQDEVTARPAPLRILRMTTWNAAEFMNATDVMGSVAAGKHADLVLLDANPVESVDHLHRIGGVVRGGRYLGPADLDALKEKVAATRSAR